MTDAQTTLALLSEVALELSELGLEVVFLGGATLPLLVKAATRVDLRPTKDVDCVIEVATHADYEDAMGVLAAAGWAPSMGHDDPMCRVRKGDIVLDVMPVPETGVGPDTPWFAPGMRRSELVELDGRRIRIFAAPYFLGTKIHAFSDRGGDDPLMSEDFEDIVALLDGAPDLVAAVGAAGAGVRTFIADWCGELLQDGYLEDTIEGCLGASAPTGTSALVVERVRALAAL